MSMNPRLGGDASTSSTVPTSRGHQQFHPYHMHGNAPLQGAQQQSNQHHHQHPPQHPSLNHQHQTQQHHQALHPHPTQVTPSARKCMCKKCRFWLKCYSQVDFCSRTYLEFLCQGMALCQKEISYWCVVRNF